jgi:ribosomal protein S18 acetylase RimI-like enzyme
MKTDPEIHCRLIGDSDVPSVAQLFTSAFTSLHAEMSRAAERVGYDHEGIVVATKCDTVIGAVYFSTGNDNNRQTLCIEQIAVRREHRRQRVCSTMLDRIAELAQQLERQYTFLAVHRCNAGAISCYTQHGFIVRDSRKAILADCDPNIMRMERDR